MSCADHNTSAPLTNDEEIAEFNSQSCKIEKATKLSFIFMPEFKDGIKRITKKLHLRSAITYKTFTILLWSGMNLTNQGDDRKNTE